MSAFTVRGSVHWGRRCVVTMNPNIEVKGRDWQKIKGKTHIRQNLGKRAKSNDQHFQVNRENMYSSGQSRGQEPASFPGNRLPSAMFSILSLSGTVIHLDAQARQENMEVRSSLCVCLVTQSCLVFSTPGTVVHQAPLSMEFSRQE